MAVTGRTFMLFLVKKAILLKNRYISKLKINSISQEILTIPYAPAGSPEEINTLLITNNI